MTWGPLNLARLEERSPLKPGRCGLIYPRGRHVFSGPQEAAKTLTAYAVALEEVRAGGIVVLIDFEMGQWEARGRFREMAATDADLERILYIEPETPATETTIADILDWSPTLAVIDAAAGAYALHGLDDNKRGDAERFARGLIRPLWVAGVATILIDHVVKNPDNRGRYAIGSERKIGGADVHLGFEAVTELTRGGRGLYRITTHKDRFGWLPRPRAADFELVSDPETHAISWAFRVPREKDAAAGPFRPTGLMERISVFLERQPEPVSRKTVEDNVSGKRDYVRMAMDALVRDRYADEQAGARRSRLLVSTRAFRANDLASTSPHDVTADVAPTAPRWKPHEEAEPPTSPHLDPTSPLVPDTTSAPSTLSPTGGADGRGEVEDGRPEIDLDVELERLRAKLAAAPLVVAEKTYTEDAARERTSA